MLRYVLKWLHNCEPVKWNGEKRIKGICHHSTIEFSANFNLWWISIKSLHWKWGFSIIIWILFYIYFFLFFLTKNILNLWLSCIWNSGRGWSVSSENWQRVNCTQKGKKIYVSAFKTPNTPPHKHPCICYNAYCQFSQQVRTNFTQTY